MARRDIRDEIDRELSIRALQRGRTEAALEPGDVVDAHRSGGRRHGEPADLRDVAALALQHADLDRILFLPFLEERDLVVARHGETQRVPDGRHPHAEIRGALAIDRDVHFGIRHVQPYLDLCDAGDVLSRSERLLRILGNLIEIRPKDVRRDGERDIAFAAAKRGP